MSDQPTPPPGSGCSCTGLVFLLLMVGGCVQGFVIGLKHGMVFGLLDGAAGYFLGFLVGWALLVGILGIAVVVELVDKWRARPPT